MGRNLHARNRRPTQNEDAEARRDELNAARHTSRTANLAEQRKAGDLLFGHYARAWLDSQRLKVAGGKLKADTLAEYERLLASHALPEFAATAIAYNSGALRAVSDDCGWPWADSGDRKASLVDGAPRVRLRASPRRDNVESG